MRNSVAVLLFSVDHKSKLLNKIYSMIRLYRAIDPFPFEHYCVFCRAISCEWWKSRSYFEMVRFLKNE